MSEFLCAERFDGLWCVSPSSLHAPQVTAVCVVFLPPTPTHASPTQSDSFESVGGCFLCVKSLVHPSLINAVKSWCGFSVFFANKLLDSFCSITLTHHHINFRWNLVEFVLLLRGFVCVCYSAILGEISTIILCMHAVLSTLIIALKSIWENFTAPRLREVNQSPLSQVKSFPLGIHFTFLTFLTNFRVHPVSMSGGAN